MEVRVTELKEAHGVVVYFLYAWGIAGTLMFLLFLY